MSKTTENIDEGAKILLLDIETAPTIAYIWGLFDETIGINQIVTKSHIISFSAKWLNSDKIIYSDQRHEKDIEDDTNLLKQVWELLDKSDVVVGHNSKKFDVKVLNSRFVIKGLPPPSSFNQIDTMVLAKKNFRFTSNKLEFLSETLCPEYAKDKHNKFPGFELWKQCLKGNIQAWKEMEKYNKRDVLALEGVFRKLMPFGGHNFNPDLYRDDYLMRCHCGSKNFYLNGFRYTKAGRYKRFKCKRCGAERQSKVNEFTKMKRASIRN